MDKDAILTIKDVLLNKRRTMLEKISEIYIEVLLEEEDIKNESANIRGDADASIEHQKKLCIATAKRKLCYEMLIPAKMDINHLKKLFEMQIDSEELNKTKLNYWKDIIQCEMAIAVIKAKLELVNDIIAFEKSI